MVDGNFPHDLILKELTIDLDKKVMKILLFIRNLANRTFFFISFSRKDLILDLLDVINNKDPKTKFSFNFRSQNTIEKNDLLEAVQNAHYTTILEYGTRIAVSLKKVMVENYKSNFDGKVLIRITEEIVQNMFCFRSLNIFKMDGIDECVIDFVVFLMRKIGSIDMESYVLDNSNYCRTLIDMLIKYTRDPKISGVVFQEVNSYLVKFVRFYKANKIHVMQNIHFEILIIFVNVLIEIMDSPATDWMNQVGKKGNLLDDLADTLADLRSLVPRHFCEYINKCAESLNTHNMMINE